MTHSQSQSQSSSSVSVSVRSTSSSSGGGMDVELSAVATSADQVLVALCALYLVAYRPLLRALKGTPAYNYTLMATK